jgi:hypothetical protein
MKKKEKTKIPRSIKAYAVVDRKNPKLKVLDIFQDKYVRQYKGEEICRVEIKFIKYI